MNRRQALKSIAVAAALPLSARELFAIGREAHAHLQSAAAERDRYIFQTLDSDESEILTVATERILPETDTPGARSARVPEFIDVILTGWFTEEERNRFLKGIRELNERALKSKDDSFLSCTESEQVRLLQELEAEAHDELGDVEPTRQAFRRAHTSPNAPFFTVLKWLTLYGYYTSKAGMEREIGWVDFPGSYDGCVSLRGK